VLRHQEGHRDGLGAVGVSVSEKRRVFVFCRPYLVADFQDNVQPLSDGFDFYFLTDGRCPGVADTRARFYALLGKAKRSDGFSVEDELDVIARCRYLRNLPRARAFEQLRAMAAVLEEEIDRYHPAVVLSHMVDDYVTHLLAEISRRRGLVYAGYAYSYFPGRIQITQYGYGAPLDVRHPSDEEVEKTLEAISQRTFRQNYLQKDNYTLAAHLKAIMRYRLKQVIFPLKALLSCDPLHMHYACLPYIVERRHWRDFPLTTDFHADWHTRVQAAVSSSRVPIVYFPLGYFPEATIDYWIEDRRVLEYQQFVLDVCRTLGAHFTVLVKEHLHMMGARSPVFYRALRDTPGVVSAPPLEFSNDVLNSADVVLMGAGSIGVESFIRGKPIVSFCNRSYWFSHAQAAFLDPARTAEWAGLILTKLRAHAEPSHEQRFEFVRACLRSTMREQRPGRRWPISEPVDLRLTLAAAMAHNGM
jgi:hypothetical protein